MSAESRFLSWQPLLTDHQACTLAALGEATGKPVATIAVRRSELVRTAQGWLPLQLTALTPYILPRRGWLRAIRTILREKPATIHLFCSPFGDLRITVALFMALAGRKIVYLISEPFSPATVGYLDDDNSISSYLKSRLRPLVYRIYGALMRHRLHGVFAISPLAVQQYRNVGIPAALVFPFGYFVSAQISTEGDSQPEATSRHHLKLCFVGSLIERKGLRRLIAACRVLGEAAPLLDVFGAGDLQQFDFDRDRVRYCGLIPFGSAAQTMSRYDALVVPSIHDGWGVVVNEAILAGIPVVCSNAVGASAMIAHWGCGIVYDPTDPDGLRNALASIIHDPDSLRTMRSAAMRLQPAIAPSVAAEYMRATIERETGSPPDCPWYRV